ncbi:hypothetical protein RhiirA4_542826 [Rhizophagus irregularis]|uniref:Uncharacterized protein n=1 Tax=Rhizophagus irregularis TaxID=588596 RepID=A0A2I1GGI3_9GLOM|nr:hypothetical protein RhiirA4_542826 [Rhizophagus irregularis]
MIDEVKDNPETRTSIDYEQEVIVVKSCVKDVDNTFNETITSYENARSIKSKKRSSRNIISSGSGTTFYEKKKDYQIEICQDGKFVATFDTANLRIRILKNTDRRPLKNNDHNESDEINETIVHFEIKDDFTICKFFNEGNDEVNNQEEDEIINFNNNAIDSSNSDEYNETRLSDRWSFDISNVCRKNDNKYFIFVAVSNIDDEDMKNKTEGRKKRKGTTTVYRVELKIDKGDYVFNKDTKTIVYHIYGVSGLCRFVEVSKNNENTEVSNLKSENKYFALRRFIILNFYGIHSFNCKDDFNFYKKLNYPKRVRDELDLSKTFDCMNPLRSCIYDKYFLVEHYKDSVQLLEVYDLAKMKLETITKRIENSHYKFARKYNRNNFSISGNKLHLCFTRGLQSVKMYFMENGLEAISKKFDEIEKIHLIEFIERDRKLLVIGNSASEEKKLKLIIWNMYNVGEIETMMELDGFLTIDNLGTRLARTSGNLLQVDNEGNVKSILKRVDKLLQQQQETEDKKGLSDLDIKRLKVIEPNERLIVHYNENINPNFKPTFIMKEPWVLSDYERNSFCLYQNKNGPEIETLQLIVGRSTIQVWHQINFDDKNKSKDKLPNKGEPFLEYIWTNGIPVNQESEKTRLQIEKFEYESNDDKLNDFKLTDFCLKVYWYEGVSKDVSEDELGIKKDDDHIEINKMEKDEEPRMERKKDREAIIEMEKNGKNQVERKVKEIRRQDIIEKVNAVRHACKALEFINKRTKFLVNYTKKHLCEEMVAYINRIIWRFIKYKPDDFKLLDVRHNVMKNLILGDCDHLIKFILFGNDDNDKKANKLHIPRKTFWKKKKTINDDTEKYEITNVMELAIYHCKGREIKDTIIVAYLLEYYTRHAIDYVGWMSTVSKALPLLFKYNYDDYVKKLFRKECFVNQNYFPAKDHYNIIPEEYQKRRGMKFRAFEVNLHSNKIKWYNVVWKLLKSYRNKTYKFFGDIDNNDIENHPLALRVVPLPEFTVNCAPQQDKSKEKIFLNILLFLFIPRWYNVGRKEKNKLSPFFRVVRYEDNDDIYDNPATEAIIDFRWKRARTHFFLLFLRFLLYILCFGLVSWAYLDNTTVMNVDFLKILIVVFYYLAAYLSATEVIQLIFHGPRKYFESIYNIFDIFSIVFPVIVMSIMLKDFRFSDGFGSVEKADTGLIVLIASSVFFLWIEGISYLRLIPNIAIYIYYVIIITKTVFPFILFNGIAIIAFAHTMFILLKETKNIKIKDSTFSGTATNPLNGQELNVSMKANFDPTDRNDNPFSYFPTAMVATFYWLSGDYVQRDAFDFWAVEVFTLIASILLVIILQNMLIAFMGGVYEKAATKGRQALLRFRANQIANYEALYPIHFPPIERDPKYIYYVGQSKTFETWYEDRKDDCAIFKDFEKKSTFEEFVFNEKNYDKFSIWDYDVDIESEIEKFKTMKNSLNDNIEKMIKNLEDRKNNDNANDIDIDEKVKMLKAIKN